MDRGAGDPATAAVTKLEPGQAQAGNGSASAQADVHDAALARASRLLASERLRADGLEHALAQRSAELSRVQLDLHGTRERERRAVHRADHDWLTQLPNRRAFMQRLEDALRPRPGRGFAVAVMFMDLDKFKSVNDRLGHQAGDQLLRIVGSRLNQALRGQDMVGRLGGDEFACLLADAPSQQQVEVVADKLHHLVSAPTQVAGTLLHVSPSIGIAISREGDGLSAEQLIHHADQAMYCAKRARSRFSFYAPAVLQQRA